MLTLTLRHSGGINLPDWRRRMLLWKPKCLDYSLVTLSCGQGSLSWRREKSQEEGRVLKHKTRLDCKDSSGEKMATQLRNLAAEVRKGLGRRLAQWLQMSKMQYLKISLMTRLGLNWTSLVSGTVCYNINRCSLGRGNPSR